MKIRNYLSTVFDGMAKGLFASLIIGTIIKQLGVYTNASILQTLGQAAQFMMGPAIGAGIALSRGVKPFTLLAALAAGALGAGSFTLADKIWIAGIGEPIGAFVSALVAVEIGKYLEGRTKFDLLIIPGVVVTAGGFIGFFVSPVISGAMTAVGEVINEFTLMQPLPMGILLSVVVGMILTLPISSTALCVSIKIGGVAAGAALTGCCAQMVGFAVISYRENKVSGLIAQGIGTSMVQMPNIIKNPWIWLPPTLASAITGPLSVMVFKMETNYVGAGMGTSGLVGPFTTLMTMGAKAWPGILLLHFLLPGVISLIVSEFMRKRGLIRYGDLKI